jgi:hypothetical protein
MVDFTTAIIFQYVEQPPLIIEHEKRLRHISLEIHVAAWYRHTNGVGLNRVTGICWKYKIWLFLIRLIVFSQYMLPS